MVGTTECKAAVSGVKADELLIDPTAGLLQTGLSAGVDGRNHSDPFAGSFSKTKPLQWIVPVTFTRGVGGLNRSDL